MNEVAKQTHRTACDMPERNKSGFLLGSIWTLFALALSAVALRFIARSAISGGVGYGMDDWTILSCLAALLLYDLLTGGLGKFTHSFGS